MIVSPEDGWQGTAAPWGSEQRVPSGPGRGFYQETNESAGMVTRDLGVVYVSCDPLICAQFKRSTSSIFTNK